MMADAGLDWFNPDTYARELAAQLCLGMTEANARAWEYGRSRLQVAITQGGNYAFETTLGGNTIASMLAQASRTHDVLMIFCGLASADQHIERVRARVASGGHAIAEDKIRERWVNSRANLVTLMPVLSRLQLFDNSAEAAQGADIEDPVLLLEIAARRMVFPLPGDSKSLRATPDWAKPIVQAAFEIEMLHRAG